MVEVELAVILLVEVEVAEAMADFYWDLFVAELWGLAVAVGSKRITFSGFHNFSQCCQSFIETMH
jgi:hypothetical protein